MQTLTEILDTIGRLENREAIRYSNGFRTRKYSYRDLFHRISAFAVELDRRGIGKGDRLLLWGENRPEWVSVFWACVSRGVQVVPVDYRFSLRLLERIQEEVQARLLVQSPTLQTDGTEIDRLFLDEVTDLPFARELEAAELSPDDVVEIVYTSGTTGEPKGVVHRHRNICANLRPFKREIERYRTWAKPFQPLRILDMLPLSHMFGQSLGLYIPVLLESSVVFLSELSPGAIIETLRRNRVSVLVAVPRLLSNVKGEIQRQFNPRIPEDGLEGLAGAALAWWRYRNIHRALGFKFWAVVVGGAEVDPRLETFWRKLGLVVVQGYGLTETSPVVSVNHPFHSRPGSIGKALEGQEVRIAPDGEILVRGDSVVTEYLGKAGVEGRLEDGWFHTGDVGEMDAEGRLYFRGRKKEVIVTPEGLNVYPQDIEDVLNRLPCVRGSTVVGLGQDGEERVHAVLILEDSGADPEKIIQQANRILESHQRIRSWSIWPEDDFPRTPSTWKVRRSEVARRMAAETSAGAAEEEKPAEPSGLEALLAEWTGKKGVALDSSVKLDEDLGLSSLERVELISRLEHHFGVELDEDRFAQLDTIGDLRELLREADDRPETRPAPVPSPHPRVETPDQPEEAPAFPEPKPEAADPVFITGTDASFPRWNRSLPARWLRMVFLHTLALPLARRYLSPTIRGLENLEGLEPPLIFAANHNSDLDTPVVYAALPYKWRRRLAPAMGQDVFQAHFRPQGYPWKERLSISLQYYLACLLFNAFPLAQRTGGVRRSLKYAGELVDDGHSILIFPEGERSRDGKMLPFKPGVGLMSVRLQVPVVPLYLSGMFEVYSVHHSWPESRPVRVHFGPALRFREGTGHEEATREVEAAVHRLQESVA